MQKQVFAKKIFKTQMLIAKMERSFFRICPLAAKTKIAYFTAASTKNKEATFKWHGCIFEFFAGSRKKLLLALCGSDLPTWLELVTPQNTC